jgi:hypothetical protein
MKKIDGLKLEMLVGKRFDIKPCQGAVKKEKRNVNVQKSRVGVIVCPVIVIEKTEKDSHPHYKEVSR